jgi:hypothetical protein
MSTSHHQIFINVASSLSASEPRPGDRLLRTIAARLSVDRRYPNKADDDEFVLLRVEDFLKAK